MANFGRIIPTEIYGPPPEVISNIPVRRNRNGSFHLKSNRNFRNLCHKSTQSLFGWGESAERNECRRRIWLCARTHLAQRLSTDERFEPLRMIARWSLFMGKLLKVRNAAERKEDVRSVNTEQECSHTKLSIVNNSNRLVYFWITVLSSRQIGRASCRERV